MLSILDLGKLLQVALACLFGIHLIRAFHKATLGVRRQLPKMLDYDARI